MKYTETKMYAEISQQPAVLSALYDTNKKTLEKIREEVKKRGITRITLAARGSSDNACVYFKYICEIYCGIPCSFAAPGVYTMYDGKLKFQNELIIGVSQSGKAADVLEVMTRAKAAGLFVVAVTNFEDSPMAQAADAHIFLAAKKEESVAATKTFTAQMYCLGLLAAELSGDNTLKAALAKVPAGISKVIAGSEKITLEAAKLIKEKDCFILARGTNLAAAFESALKMQETTYIKAKAFAVSDFHHGPFAMIDEECLAILLMPEGQSYASTLEMLNKCAGAGARTLVYTDTDAKGSVGTIAIPTGSDAETPFYNVAATQLLVNSLSVLRGNNPDAPRGLNKVTITK
jgi:glucosamine--fructose-6-phosphate aminotransferase (isomerizing)